MKKILLILLCCCAFNIAKGQSEFTCTDIGAVTAISDWSSLCGAPIVAPSSAGTILGTLSEFTVSTCNTNEKINVLVEYYTPFEIEVLPDNFPGENLVTLTGSENSDIDFDDFSTGLRWDFAGGAPASTYSDHEYLPLWQQGTFTFEDTYGDGWGDDCVSGFYGCNYDSFFDPCPFWVDIPSYGSFFGPDGALLINWTDATFQNAGGCGDGSGVAPIVYDFSADYQGGTMTLTSDIDGILATITSAGAGIQVLGTTVVNNTASGVSAFDFAIDPTQLTPGLHTFTVDLSGYVMDCNEVLQSFQIEVLDCDPAPLFDDPTCANPGINCFLGGAEAASLSDARFDFEEIEGCTPSTGAPAGVNSANTDATIWLKGGGAFALNPGLLCSYDMNPLSPGDDATWDFGIMTRCGGEPWAEEDGAPVPGPIPNIAEGISDIDANLNYISYDNRCAPILFGLPVNYTCNTKTYYIYAYQFVYGRDLDCDTFGEYNPAFGPVVFTVKVMPNDPIVERITQVAVCPGQPLPDVVLYGHDINGNGHLDEIADCSILDCAGLPIPEICHRENAPDAMASNPTCAPVPEAFDPAPWIAADQQAMFSAPTAACYVDINEPPVNHLVNTDQPTFVPVGMPASPICSGSPFDYTVSIRVNGTQCGTKAITSAPTNTTCAPTVVAVPWTVTDAEARTAVGYVAPTEILPGCPHTHDSPATHCVVGGSGSEDADVNPAQPTLAGVPGACGTAAVLNLVAANGTTCSAFITGTTPVEPACTATAGTDNDNQPIAAGTATAAAIGTALGAADGSCYADINYSEVAADCLSPACAASCPAAPAAVPGSDAVCSGGGTGTLAAWQNARESAVTAVDNASTVSTVEYSTAVPTAAVPATGAGNVTGTIPAGCSLVPQATTAYMRCDNGTPLDATDDVWTAIGVYTLTVYPAVQAPTIIRNDATCTYTINPACPGDVLSPSTVADAAPGTAATTISIDVTPASGCPLVNFPVAVPACPVGCAASKNMTWD